MDDINVTGFAAVVQRIRAAQANADEFRITQHAHQEMVEEEITDEMQYQGMPRGIRVCLTLMGSIPRSVAI